MCIPVYVPHFKTIERFSITFQTANGKREIVPPALYSCEKIISFKRIVLDCSYQLISSLRNSELDSAVWHNRYSRSL